MEKETQEQESQEKKAQEKEHEAARKQVDAILDSSRPKNLREGVASGVGNILGGAVGAVGAVVLAPTVGLVSGAKRGGVLGGVVGFTGGAVVGAVGGAVIAVGGVVRGIKQMGRGVAAVPKAMIEPRKGNWWNETEGLWIETNLETEATDLKEVPDDDNDILGAIEPDANEPTDEAEPKKDVVDLFYYDILGVEPSADQGKIKRQYYVLARKYHPDKAGADDKESAEKFKNISEAYQVLSDEELRAKYDTEGRDGLSPDKTSTAGEPDLNPSILFTVLFGSDKFHDYIGRLAMATSALVGDSQKISPQDSRILQKRRTTRLAIKLADRLNMWASGEEEAAKVTWACVAEELSKASYGYELVTLIGQCYALSAVQFLGSLDSGVGMPSIGSWASSHYAGMKLGRASRQANAKTMMAGLNMLQSGNQAKERLSKANTEEEKQLVEEEMKEGMHSMLLQVMWTTTVVDIANTIHETTQMVLFDKSVDTSVRKMRGHGLKALGDVFINCPKVQSDLPENATAVFEEAAFAAMLETIKRKDDEAFSASRRF